MVFAAKGFKYYIYYEIQNVCNKLSSYGEQFSHTHASAYRKR